jgi:hypothetical protein
VSNFEFCTKDTVEAEDEQLQESEREDSGSDTNILQASYKRVHLVRGRFVLFDYLMPPKITATAQGEHVLFDIDVKGGEKNLGALVAINSKGGDCWKMFNR